MYRISCKDCDASYVGRPLRTRISEHCNYIKRNIIQHLVITIHRLLNYELNWDKMDVLDKEPNLRKRLLLEIIYINRQRNSLNL